MDGFQSFLQQNSWLGLLVYVLLKEGWPFFRDRIYPRRIAERDAEKQRLQNLEDRAIQNEERQTRAIENMSLASQQMALAITTNNERMSQLISNHGEHDRFIREALSKAAPARSKK